MTDIRASRITPASPVTRSAPVEPVRRELLTTAPADPKQPKTNTVVAATSGTLRPAYAQYQVDPTTHDTVISIRDTNTGAVISEFPSVEVQAMNRALKAYAETAARHQAARQIGAAT